MRALQHLLISVCVLALLAACQQAPQEETQEASGENLAVSEDGVPIYFQSRGQGDYTLVFVHGWCTDMSYWDAQIPSFRVYYRVVTLDLAGHGRSGRDRAVWSMEAFGQDVAAVVRKLDLNNVILIGHSLGGPVVLEAARLPGYPRSSVPGHAGRLAVVRWGASAYPTFPSLRPGFRGFA